MPQYNGITVPTLVLNTAVPVPPPDNRVATTGALLYVDPTHPANPMPAGVSVVPNLVAQIAAKTIGSTNIDHTRIGVRNTFGVGEGVVERTAKGGIYIASSRTQDVVDHVYQLLMDPETKAWILANKQHMFYFTLSIRVLRPGSTGQNTHIFRLGQNSTAFAIAAQEGSSVPSTSVSGVPQPNRTTAAAPGLMRISAAGRGQDDSRPVNITSLVDWFISGGPLTAAALHKAADFIFYGSYVEDLTVSGRSFAEVEAQFGAQHAQLHGTGGRFAGDTWRDPATIA